MIREEYYSLQAGFIYMDYNCYEHTLSLTATFISQSPRKQTNYISVAPSESLPLPYIVMLITTSHLCQH